MSTRENPTNTLSLAQVPERLAALEITVNRLARQRETRNNRTKEPVAPACYSIRDFCIAHCISEDMFFKMQRQGLTPKTMKVGVRTLVSMEAAAEWRRQCEAAENAANARKHTGDGE
jgi:hypothetical protein